MRDTLFPAERAVASWPVSSLFPPLGLLRSFALRAEFAREVAGREAALLKAVLRAAPSEVAHAYTMALACPCMPTPCVQEKTEAPAAAQLMALCTLANLCSLQSFVPLIVRPCNLRLG